jgi:hypothetical protein
LRRQSRKAASSELAEVISTPEVANSSSGTGMFFLSGEQTTKEAGNLGWFSGGSSPSGYFCWIYMVWLQRVPQPDTCPRAVRQTLLRKSTCSKPARLYILYRLCSREMMRRQCHSCPGQWLGWNLRIPRSLFVR